MMSHKIVFYEGAIRIPLIIRPPGGVNGCKCQGLSDHLDIAASLIDIAGANPLTGSEGRSLIPQILDGPNGHEAQKGKDVIFSEIYGYSMVHSERYKMAVLSDTQKPIDLYDLKNDPDELKNLVKDPNLESIRKELLDNYLSRLLTRLDKKKFENMNVNGLSRQIEKDIKEEQKGS
jgi:arylsulfatase A-like enzyme